MVVVIGAAIVLGIVCLLAFILAATRLAANADRAARPQRGRSD